MLTQDECMSFMKNGYIVLRDVMDREACSYGEQKIWFCMPDHFEPGVPKSWTGRIEDCRTTSELFHRRGHVKFQKDCKAGPIGTDPTLLSLVSNNERVLPVVQQLLGPNVRPGRVRGLYSIWPAPKTISFRQMFGEKVPPRLVAMADRLKVPYLFSLPSDPHIEGHPMHIVGVGYMTDARRDGGALLVWPGSHRDLYSQFESTAEHIARPKCVSVMKRLRRLRPVQVVGNAGDVILFHHRLLHAPSVHRVGKVPRHTIFVDFARDDIGELSRLAPGDLWEHWPGLAPFADDPRAHGSALADLTPAFWRRKAFDRLRLSLRKLTRDGDKLPAGTKHVGARDRNIGDVWLLLSDSAEANRNNALQTVSLRSFGADLSIAIGDEEIAPRDQPVAPLNLKDQLDRGRNYLTIKNAGAPVHVRLIRLTIPFHESKVVFRERIEGTAELDVRSLLNAA